MQILAAVAAALTALPELIKLAREVFAFFKHLAGDDPQGYVRDLGSAFEKLNQAKTAEDRQNAAIDLVRLIKRT